MYNKWLRGVRITGFHFPYVRILFEWISASKYSRWHIANVAFELHWRDSFSLNISPYTVQCTLYIPHLQSKHVNHIHPHSCNKQHNTTQSMPFIKIPFLKRKQKKTTTFNSSSLPLSKYFEFNWNVLNCVYSMFGI